MMRAFCLSVSRGLAKADDGVRTRDPQLGKLMLYQLSYVREASIVAASRGSKRPAKRRHGLVYQ
jgi:hypothetical protein